MMKHTIRKAKKDVEQKPDVIFSGERGIRTPGASQHDGFQDRCNRPLYHLSNEKACKVTQFRRNKGENCGISSVD